MSRWFFEDDSSFGLWTFDKAGGNSVGGKYEGR